MDNEVIYRQEIIRKYRSAMGDLFRYIPWLEEKVGTKTVHNYDGDNRPDKSVPVPVYDSTLLSFVKEMQKTGLVNRNYVYVYSHYGVKDIEDELRVIEKAKLSEIDAVLGIMGKYVIGGMTRGALWSEGVQNGIFLCGLKQIKALLDIWDGPLA